MASLPRLIERVAAGNDLFEPKKKVSTNTLRECVGVCVCGGVCICARLACFLLRMIIISTHGNNNIYICIIYSMRVFA